MSRGLIGTDGKPLERKITKQVIFFESADGEDWDILKPYNVPTVLSDNEDVMKCLLEGEIIEAPTKKFYRVESLN